MPELPEVQAMADVIGRDFSGSTIVRAQLGSLSALKTYDPPLDALAGATLTGTGRVGKFLVLHLVDADGVPLDLVIHLSRAGWIHWRTTAAKGPLRPGKSPVAMRLEWAGTTGDPTVLDITEAGTQKRLALYIVRDVAEVEATRTLGPDALDIDEPGLERILKSAGKRHLKTLLRDQKAIAGIGNAYSDEILHAARLSPYAAADSLDAGQVTALHTAVRTTLTGALERAGASSLGQMKAEKREGLRVHGRAGQPCDECGTVIAEVRLADSSFQYCPTCQTNGKPLADRKMSRLLK